MSSASGYGATGTIYSVNIKKNGQILFATGNYQYDDWVFSDIFENLTMYEDVVLTFEFNFNLGIGDTYYWEAFITYQVLGSAYKVKSP